MKQMATFIKTCLSYFLKVIYIGSFFLMIFMLLKMLYFPEAVDSDGGKSDDESVFAEYVQNEEMLGSIKKGDEKITRGHFHITDEHLAWQEYIQPLCLNCHGVYPHIKNEKTMSYLNLHTGFTACEICHVRISPEEENNSFTWVDLETGETTMKVDGGYGKYKARIIPVIYSGGKEMRIDTLVREKFRNLYFEMKKKKYTLEQQQDEIVNMHKENLSKKPVACLECHTRKGYLDFARLGFDKSRINQLESSEVSLMVEHYDTFHMPKMIISR